MSGIHESSVLSSSFFYKSKIILNNKGFFNQAKKKKKTQKTSIAQGIGQIKQVSKRNLKEIIINTQRQNDALEIIRKKCTRMETGIIEVKEDKE